MKLVVINAKKRLYSHYNGKKLTTAIICDELLSKLDIERFRKDPIKYIDLPSDDSPSIA